MNLNKQITTIMDNKNITKIDGIIFNRILMIFEILINL